MDRLNEYRRVIEESLTEYARLLEHSGLQTSTVFDHANDRYLLIKHGWRKDERVHYCVLHVEIINGKIWIQCDHTEEGVAADFERAGVPKDQIVLGFREPELRPYTGYAAA